MKKARIKLESYNSKNEIKFKEEVKSICELKHNKLIAVAFDKKINLYNNVNFNKFLSLNENNKIYEISELQKGNLLICGKNFFKIYGIGLENKDKNEIQNQTKDGIIKIIESKNNNNYLLSVSKNNGGTINIWEYDKVNKNYKEKKEKEIKLNIVPTNLFLEMSNNAFCIQLTDGNLYFYEKNDEGNYIQKPTSTNFKPNEKDESKIYKYNDDIIIMTNYLDGILSNIMCISLKKNKIVFEIKCAFDLNNITVLSNGIILATTYDTIKHQKKFIIRELVYDEKDQKITNTNRVKETKGQIVKMIEISENRLIIISKSKVMEIFRILNI